MRVFNGQPQAVVNQRDVTEQENARRREEEVEANLQVARKIETIGTLAGGVAHDFNNLLTPILFYAEMWSTSGEEGTAGVDYALEVHGAAVRAQKLVNQILIFAREGDHQMVAIDLSLVVRDAIDLIGSTMPESIKIEQRIEDGLTVSGNASQLHQIVSNLCMNAEHAMGGDGTLTAGIVRSAPGVGDILAGQIMGRLGDPKRFANLAAARSFTGLIPKQNSSGLTNHAGGPTKRGDACLKAARFQAADRARHVDPQLAARYQRLMCETGRHHNSATCTVATVLLTRIVSCLRQGVPYELRDIDGKPISDAEGRAIVNERYRIPDEVRAARRSVSNARSAKRRDERVKKGVAERSEEPPVPEPA